MTNKKRQEIIDYLESGSRFAKTLINELQRQDLQSFEKRTYSSLLDALTGATELYCAMTEWPDNVIYITRKPETDEINENDAIIINHGLRTMDAVKETSEYVKSLPLDNTQNEKLVELMKEQLLVAEYEAYIQGFADCMDAVQSGGFKGLEDKIVKGTQFDI